MNNVLIACEESQTICEQFRLLGVNAYSCDVKKSSGAEWLKKYHIRDDVRNVIVNDGKEWDLIIAHPPCQCLCRLDTMNYSKFGEEWAKERAKKRELAREFFYFFYNLKTRVCIENPIPAKASNLPPYTQIIQPFDFNENFSKATCLWLKNLPYLMPTVIELRRRPADIKQWTAENKNATLRSKTFKGIARAMAEQWYNL